MTSFPVVTRPRSSVAYKCDAGVACLTKDVASVTPASSKEFLFFPGVKDSANLLQLHS